MDSLDSRRTGEIIARSHRQLAPFGASTRGPKAASSASPLSWRVVVQGAKRWWWQGLALWVLGTVGLCMAIQSLLAPSYEASSLLRVEPMTQDLFSGASNQTSFQSYMETQVKLITSDNILTTALTDAKATGLEAIRRTPAPESLLRRMLKVNIIPNSHLIEVSTTSRSGVEAAGVVNAVVASYLSSDADWSDSMTRGQIKNLAEYQKGLDAQIKEKEKALLEIAARGNAAAEPVAPGRDPATAPTRASVTIEEYQRLQDQLMKSELDLVEAEAVRDAHRAEAARDESRADAGGLSATEMDKLVGEEFRRDPEVARVVETLEQIDGRIAKLGRVVRNSSDPAVLDLERQRAGLNDRYRRLWEAKQEGIRERLSLSPSAIRGTSQEAESKVASLRSVKAKLEERLSTLEVKDRERSTDAVKATLIQSDLRRLEEMSAALNRRLEQLRFEARGQARVMQISKARPPSQPASDKRPRFLAIAPGVMLLLILGLGTFLEIMAGRVRGIDDLGRRTSLEVFAVPPPATQARSMIGGRSRSLEEITEEFVHRIDYIREALCAGVTTGGMARCVVITSAVAGEGKTSLASHLAIRCANAGISTLLIDADLRRASLGQLFDIPEGPGLADVLRGEATLQDAVVFLGDVRCHLLPAGNPDANPSSLILGRQFGPTLEKLRRAYEVVIIDAPPVLPVPDGLTLGRWADGVVLATRHDTSRVRLVEQAIDLIRSAGIPVLGAVVHGVHSSTIPGGGYASVYRSIRDDRPEAS